MTDPTSPSPGSLHDTLTSHYRGEIARLRSRGDVAAEVTEELDSLERGFEAGFDDALCDRFEALVRRISAGSPLAYLAGTPTGTAVGDAAAARLERDERVVAQLTARLREESEGRREVASALREALSSHRRSWQLAAERDAVPRAALAPARALHESLSAGVEALLRQQVPVPTSAPEPASSAPTIDVARLLRRADGPATSRTSPMDAAFAVERVQDDGTLHELLRSRVDQARAAIPDAASPAPLLGADRQLAAVARGYGAAMSHAALQKSPSVTADRPAEVARLRALRADIYRQRVQSSNTSGAARAAMERRHARLVAEASSARATALESGAESDVARARADIARELSGLQGTDVPADVLAALRATVSGALEAPQALSPEASGVAEAEAALMDALATSAPDAAEIATEVATGATDHQRVATGVLARRLMARQSTRAFASLPDFGASAVYATDRPALDPLPDEDTSMWTGVEDRRRTRESQEPAPAAPPRIAALGRAIAGSIERLVTSSGPRSAPRVQQGAAEKVMPRMAAKMPSNIFADTSSRRMQSLYMPVLARMVGRPTPMLARPRARRKDNTGNLLNSVATPEGLYSLLLGELGDRLYEEKPEIARRLEGSLKRAAAALPGAGDEALPVLQRHTEQFRTTVETWLGAGSQEGVERGRTEEVLSAGQGAARTIGDYVGGMFAIDQHGAGASEIDLLQERHDEVEQQLRAERTFVDQSLLDRVSGMVGRGPSKNVEAYQGPMAQAIAQEMGAEAFTVENKMFFPHAVPESIKAHEMVHAIEASSDSHPRTIEDEERLAYGVQGKFEQGRKTIDQELRNATERMELAKEQNIPPPQLTTDPGGVAGTEDPDPALRTSNPKDQMHKEEQLLEAVTDAVESMIMFEEDLDRERYGRT